MTNTPDTSRFLLALLLLLLTLSACQARPEQGKTPEPAISPEEAAAGQRIVKEGDRVHVEYVGRLEDGTEFERSRENKPLVFTVGSGQIKGFFDQAVRGMKLHEEKQVALPCKSAYGQRDTTLVRAFPRRMFPSSLVLGIGKTISLQFKKDQPQQPATVVDTTTNHVILDLNHPLAGHDLTYTLKVIVIELPDQLNSD
jgi:peptidylprolyl isomerase